MRGAKYKVWDKQDKQWIEDWGDIFIDFEGTVYLIEERTWAYQSYMHKEDITEKVEVVFSTGLKDKNGKEIYEGDIVNGYVVEYQEERGGFFPFAKDDGCGCCSGEVIWEVDLAEVEGNIYENPELLEGESNV